MSDFKPIEDMPEEERNAELEQLRKSFKKTLPLMNDAEQMLRETEKKAFEAEQKAHKYAMYALHLKRMHVECPKCGSHNVHETLTCGGCEKILVPIVLTLHENIAKDLDWLIQYTKHTSSDKESSIHVVMERLISLEVGRLKRKLPQRQQH